MYAYYSSLLQMEERMKKLNMTETQTKLENEKLARVSLRIYIP